MPGFLVRGSGLGVAINFHQYETSRVVLLLDDIEARDAGFFQTFARVGERGLCESFDALRLDANMDVNNEHGCDEYAKAVKSSSTGGLRLVQSVERFFAVHGVGDDVLPEPNHRRRQRLTH